MSYSFDGKVSNQRFIPNERGNAVCAKCNTVIPSPTKTRIPLNKKFFLIESYINTPFYIYESKSGKSVCYCSSHCKKAHNHRFSRRG